MRCTPIVAVLLRPVGLLRRMEAPDLLVLDEPTNALDEESRGRLAGIIGEERDRGAAVLLSSHDPDFLSGVCDATYHMDVGEMRPSGGQR